MNFASSLVPLLPQIKSPEKGPGPAKSQGPGPAKSPGPVKGPSPTQMLSNKRVLKWASMWYSNVRLEKMNHDAEWNEMGRGF